MAGNSARRGAIKKSGKGNPTAGSGGRRRADSRARADAEGEGPRGHKAHKAEKRATKSASARAQAALRGATPNGSRAATRSSRRSAPACRSRGVRRRGRGARRPAPRGVQGDRRAWHLGAGGAPVELDRLTNGAVHQGLAAKVPAYEYAHPDDLLPAPRRGEPALIVALDGGHRPAQPRRGGPVGGRLRRARCSRARAAGGRDDRVGVEDLGGCCVADPVAQAMNLTRQLKSYQPARLMVVGLAADGDVSLPDLDIADGPLVIVVGSEGEGLSRLVTETCDQLVSIPMVNVGRVAERRGGGVGGVVHGRPGTRRVSLACRDAGATCTTSGSR